MGYKTKGFGANNNYSGRNRPKKTEYAGVRFRSQLEARWAAFFDLCELDWEYEPCTPSEVYTGWRPDFRLQLIYRNIPAKQIPFYFDFYAEVKPCSLNPFPDGIARKLMYAHPYNHELLSIDELLVEDVGCPEKDVTACPYDRVVILGDSPCHHDTGKMIISTFKAVSEIEFSEKYQCMPQSSIFISGWYSACFINDSRIWSPVKFLSGDKKNIDEAWKIAKSRIRSL